MKEFVVKQETHKHIWLKFLLVVSIFFGYFVFISFQYGLNDGFLITWLTWSFFVLCTPVADAGFLIDFPIRILLKYRMFVSEFFVWGIAILLNFYAYFFSPETYQKTKMLSLFEHILSEPIPFWIIIILSGIGTFLSIKFGDELFDVLKHKNRKYHKKHHFKWKAISMVFIFFIILVIYDFLLKKLGIEIPL